MQIFFNGTPREVVATNLADILTELDFVDTVVATAVNGEFISVENRINTVVNEGDRLEILAPMQGG